MSSKIAEYVFIGCIILVFFGFILYAYFNGKKNTEMMVKQKNKNEKDESLKK
jgi:hypothetical protein